MWEPLKCSGPITPQIKLSMKKILATPQRRADPSFNAQFSYIGVSEFCTETPCAFIYLFIYREGRIIDRGKGKKCDLPFASSHLRAHVLQVCAMQVRSQEAGVHLGIPCGQQGPNTWTIFHCFFSGHWQGYELEVDQLRQESTCHIGYQQSVTTH